MAFDIYRQYQEHVLSYLDQDEPEQPSDVPTMEMLEAIPEAPSQPPVDESEGNLGETILQNALGIGEAALTVGSGLASSVPAGLAGLGQLATGEDLETASKTIEEITQAGTYIPRSEEGIKALEALSVLGIPADIAAEWILEQTGSPAAATATNVLVDPLNFIPGFAAFKILKRKPQMAEIKDEVVPGKSYQIMHGTAGTMGEIKKFDVSSTDKKDIGYFGPAVYGTSSDSLANRYAELKGNRMKAAGRPSEEYIAEIQAYLENPKILSKEEGLKIKQASMGKGGSQKAIEFQKELIEQGYDGVIWEMADDAVEYAIFNPDNAVITGTRPAKRTK